MERTLHRSMGPFFSFHPSKLAVHAKKITPPLVPWVRSKGPENSGPTRSKGLILETMDTDGPNRVSDTDGPNRWTLGPMELLLEQFWTEPMDPCTVGPLKSPTFIRSNSRSRGPAVQNFMERKHPTPPYVGVGFYEIPGFMVELAVISESTSDTIRTVFQWSHETKNCITKHYNIWLHIT